MEVLEETQCCGVNEIASIQGYSGSKECLKAVARDFFNGYGSCAYITFTQASRNGNARYGLALRDYIRRHKLGSVVSIGGAKNPNSGNDLVVFVWRVNRDVFEAWAIKHDALEHDDNDDLYDW